MHGEIDNSKIRDVVAGMRIILQLKIKAYTTRWIMVRLFQLKLTVAYTNITLLLLFGAFRILKCTFF